MLPNIAKMSKKVQDPYVFTIFFFSISQYRNQKGIKNIGVLNRCLTYIGWIQHSPSFL